MIHSRSFFEICELTNRHRFHGEEELIWQENGWQENGGSIVFLARRKSFFCLHSSAFILLPLIFCEWGIELESIQINEPVLGFVLEALSLVADSKTRSLEEF